MKNFFTHYFFLFFILVFSFVFGLPELKAQTGGGLPTQAQVDAKLAQLAAQNYQTGLGIYNPTNKGVMVTGAMQDCANAITVCTQSYAQGTSYTGHGTTQEVSASSCLLGQETNSVWYIFTCQSIAVGSTFGFTLTTTKDYDFALYNITDIGCAGVPAAVPVRCNYSATLGNTGMSSVTTATELPALSINAAGSSTSSGISNMVVGQTYALIIDNYSADATGYSLTFTGDASITDTGVPTLSSLTKNCNPTNTITLDFSEQVKCNSIVPSDFSITPAGFTVSAASGVGCSSSNITTQASLTLTGTPVSGTYTIHINSGGDGNTILDKCDNAMSTAQTITFDYLASVSLTATPSSICAGATASLDANGVDGTPSVSTYTLNPGGLTNTTNGIFGGISPAITTNYSVSVTYGGCTNTANASVTVEGNILTTISPTSKSVCSFPTPMTATTYINGVACVGCTYVWSTTETINPISVASAGTYTVVATTPAGCNNSNSPSGTVSLASTGSGGTSCDVIYVSPAGGGDGYTKTAPTTLSDAVTKAQCTYTIIKMQKGVYTLTDFQYVNSYATIEGGYDALFLTKYSDLSGDANSTTIRRSNAGDSDDVTKCSAFKVADASDQFRLQDLRIEMPGSASVAGHAASANKTNYGIKVGTGCTNYNIVRCYIDAGIGSAP